MRKTIFIILFVAIFGAAATARAGKPAKPRDQQTERTIAVDPQVALTVCLHSGNVTVRGWDKNEIRARSSDGMGIDFQKAESGNTDLPRELSLVSDRGRSRLEGRCLSFGDIELDVPRAASVNLQAGNSDINASGIARLRVTSHSGSITAERVTQALAIQTIGGDISIANSKGSIKLHSVGGSIRTHDASPNNPGDVYEAGTVSGDITLDGVSHTEVKANTVSGTLSFSGGLVTAGHYSFETISGDVDLLLPANSSFRLSANYSDKENFNSAFPLQTSSTEDVREDNRGLEIRHLNATYGASDISITISSFNGTIKLRKK